MCTPTGTSFYKAPEIWQAGGFTEKVDMWACAIILYEAFNGKPPYGKIK